MSPLPNPIDTVQRFRDLFFGCLDGRNGWSSAELVRANRHANLVYLPDPSLLSVPASASGNLADAVDRTYADADPQRLYARAAARPPSPVPRAEIEAALLERPLTVVVFPGIFGEFVDVLPFDEVARNDRSAYAREWQRLLDAWAASHSQTEVEATLSDEHFALAELTLGPAPRATVRSKLQDLFAVSSIDDASGRPLVRLIVFRHPLDSLETVSGLRHITPVLSARLDKLFTVLGVPEHLVLLGYSMGADVALDVVAEAHAAGVPWLDRLRAVVTVGGVVHGSHLADAARAPAGATETSLHRQVRLLEQMTKALEETAQLPFLTFGGSSKVSVWWRNVTVWRRFLPDIRAVVADLLRGGHPVSPTTLFKLLKRSDFSPTLSLVLSLATRTIHPFAINEYSLNIRKVKTLVARVLAGVDNLTSQGRHDWWQNHVLPTDGVRYYAIAGTMPGAAVDAAGAPLLENQDAYASPSLDLTFLTKSYDDYVTVSGQRLNDSQVSVSRAQFWPELLPQLNPHYREHPMDGQFLGVLGEHHWGLVLPEVNHLKGDLENPFPRTALLEALAAQVAMDMEGDR